MIKLRTEFRNKKSAKKLFNFCGSAKNKEIDWKNYTPIKPAIYGIKVFEIMILLQLHEYIDWGPFFIAWEMHGKFPAILTDEKIGKEAPNCITMHRFC